MILNKELNSTLTHTQIKLAILCLKTGLKGSSKKYKYKSESNIL